MLEKLFRLKENNANVRTEVIGGITTFMTMAYILAVNPQILAASGMDKNAILMATALAAFIGTMIMAFMANYPFALAPKQYVADTSKEAGHFDPRVTAKIGTLDAKYYTNKWFGTNY